MVEGDESPDRSREIIGFNIINYVLSKTTITDLKKGLWYDTLWKFN